MTFDDRIKISTPEGVNLDLLLAGLGSRFAAVLLDLAIQVGAIIALTIVLGAAGVDSGYAVAVYLVLTFLVLFAYDIVLETWNSGRSVGKMAAGLRVVRADGGPVNFLTAAIRNLVRIADFLPAFYLVGMFTILVTARNQRLGDLAAGTVVIRERRTTTPSTRYAEAYGQMAATLGTSPSPYSWDARIAEIKATVEGPPSPPTPPPFLAWDVSMVTNDDVAIVRQFLDRRGGLDAGAREHLARDLASRLHRKVGADADGWHPEAFLEGVVAAKSARG